MLVTEVEEAPCSPIETRSLLTLQRPWTQMSLVSVPQGVPSATRSFSW